MKSHDNYFQGFPAAWNVVALCFYLIEPGPWLSLLSIFALALLTATRVQFLHPFRVRKWMGLNIIVTFVWLLSGALLILSHPLHSPPIMGLWLAASAYFLGVCLWRSAQEWFSKAS